MHYMFDENAKHGKFLRLFSSLLGSRSQLVKNGLRDKGLRFFLTTLDSQQSIDLELRVSCRSA